MSTGTIDLSIGDPGYEPPDEARAVAVRAIGRGLGGYAPVGGLTRLRRALAGKLVDRNGIMASPEEVVITSGASLGIFATLATLCRPGDRILVPDPCFPLYRLAAATLNLRAVSYPLAGRADGHQPDWAALAELIPGARMLLWNYPSNPLGAPPRTEWSPRLFDLLATAPELMVLSDEVYEDLCLDGEHVSLAAGAGELADRIVSLFSFSKGYGMAAWRVGYLHAPAELAARVARAQWAATMSTSTVGQHAALAALSAPPTYLAQRRAFLRDNRDLAVCRLRAVGLGCDSPAGGFFAWVDIAESGLSAPEFTQRCAEDTGVLLSPGDDFGAAGRGHIRLNYAVSRERLDAGLTALCGWVTRLRP